MLLLLGKNGSPLASGFSNVFPDEQLKTSMMLNEANFKDLLPTMDDSAVILIEKGQTAGRHHKELLEAIRERDMVVVVKDCQGGSDLDGYAAVTPRGKYVVVKNSLGGRRQRILVMSKGKDFHSSLMQFKNLKDDDSPHESKPLNYWEHFTTLHFDGNVDASPTHSSAPDWLNDRLRTGSVKWFCTIDIWLYATKTPRKKWIRFKLTDAVGMSASMGSDDKWARGFFNKSAHLYLYPGRGEDPDTSMLPEGWSRPSLQPKTPNSSTKYKSTTGWTFGVSGGGSSSGPSANVTATHKDDQEEETVINDFSVRNISDESMTGWDFYYTAVDGEHWKDHFNWKEDVLPIADLAKSTLNLNAECLYRGPPDTNEKIPWSFKLKFTYSCLRGNWQYNWEYPINYSYWITLTMNMGVVRNPDP